jgi:hypothetical protein
MTNTNTEQLNSLMGICLHQPIVSVLMKKLDLRSKLALRLCTKYLYKKISLHITNDLQTGFERSLTNNNTRLKGLRSSRNSLTSKIKRREANIIKLRQEQEHFERYLKRDIDIIERCQKKQKTLKQLIKQF